MSRGCSNGSDAPLGGLRLGVVRGREPVVRFANGDRRWLPGPPLCGPGAETLVAWDGARVAGAVAEGPAGAHAVGIALVARRNVVLFALCEAPEVTPEALRAMPRGAPAGGVATVLGAGGEPSVVVSARRGIVDPDALEEGEAARAVGFRVRAFDALAPNGAVRAPAAETPYHAFLVPARWAAEGAAGFWFAEAAPADLAPGEWLALADRFLDPICDAGGFADGARGASEIDRLRLRSLAAG